MAHLVLCLLGAFQAHLNGQRLAGFESDKARALLAYLAIEANRPHSRAQLAGLFWPDWPELEARAHLRHALANLRRLLGDRDSDLPFLLVTRNTLQFNSASDCRIDAVQISRGLAHLPHLHDETLPQIQEAVAQYHSPFLEGFFLDGCARFEEWVLLTRERLQRQVLEALRLLTDYFMAKQDHRQAIVYAQQWVDLEPWQEEAHAHLMRLLALTGQRGAALAQYERCRRVLAAELGVSPRSETSALFERIKAEAEAQGIEQRADRQPPVDAVMRSPELHKARQPGPLQNLPAPVTPLVGRAETVSAVTLLFRDEEARLVSLTGPGGVGKTRLAVQIAQGLSADFPDGVFFVDLAPIQEPALVISAVAQVLGVREIGSRPVIESVQAQIQGQKLLLVLDNFEHVLAAAPIVSALLTACAQLRVLVTSRERLRVRGEYEYVVAPLAVPTNILQRSSAELAAFAAVELFRQRAVAARQGFVLDEETAPAVAQLCARLDGLPLAIELAAAHLKLFSPRALLRRFEEVDSSLAWTFLKAGTRDAPDRHQSLWDAISWSYKLLNADEQALFRRMAVFAGGCTLAAVAEVCTEDAGVDLFACLASLVDKNLLRQDEQPDGDLRFGMLETLREFGLRQLADSGELERIQRRHAEYYLALAETVDQQIQQMAPTQLVWLARLEADHNNLRAALLWTMQRQEINLGLRLGAALPNFWMRRGHHQEAYGRLTALLAQWQGQELPSPIEDILYFTGLFAIRQSDLDTAFALFEQAAEASRRVGNQYRLAYAVALMAHLSHDRGDYAASDTLSDEAIQLSNQVQDTFGAALAISHRGRMLASRGRADEGALFAEQEEAMLSEQGEPWGRGIVLGNLGQVRRWQGALGEAQALFQEALRLGHALGDTSTLAAMSFQLGCVHVDRGELATGRRYLQESLHLHHQMDMRSRIADALDAFARVAVAQHQPERALRLLAAAARLRASVGFVLAPLIRAEVDKTRASAEQVLAPDAAQAAWAEGAAMSLDEVVAYAQGVDAYRPEGRKNRANC